MFNLLKPKFQKTSDQIEKIIKAGALVSLIKSETKTLMKPGLTGIDVENQAKLLMAKHGAISATLNYRGYPSSICVSINEVLVHGIPNNVPFQEGDLVTVDISLSLDGYFADSAYTEVIKKFNNPEDEKLFNASKSALNYAISLIKPGLKVRDLGFEIEKYVEQLGFKVSHDFVGHGIGKKLHEDPSIPNFGDKHNKAILEENMVICIEPMLLIRNNQIFIDPIDGWTVRSINGKNTVHDEETILITKEGAKVLTK